MCIHDFRRFQEFSENYFLMSLEKGVMFRERPFKSTHENCDKNFLPQFSCDDLNFVDPFFDEMPWFLIMIFQNFCVREVYFDGLYRDSIYKMFFFLWFWGIWKIQAKTDIFCDFHTSLKGYPHVYQVGDIWAIFWVTENRHTDCDIYFLSQF